MGPMRTELREGKRVSQRQARHSRYDRPRDGGSWMDRWLLGAGTLLDCSVCPLPRAPAFYSGAHSSRVFESFVL